MVKPGEIVLDLSVFHRLMDESNSKPMDLVRYGMAQGTAYKLCRSETNRVSTHTATLLCQFFSERLERPILVDHILTHESD